MTIRESQKPIKQILTLQRNALRQHENISHQVVT